MKAKLTKPWKVGDYVRYVGSRPEYRIMGGCARDCLLGVRLDNEIGEENHLYAPWLEKISPFEQMVYKHVGIPADEEPLEAGTSSAVDPLDFGKKVC